MKKLLMVVPIFLLGSSMSFAQVTTDSKAANLTVNVGAEASLSTIATTALTSSSTFGAYTGQTSLTYRVRTTQAGAGTITAAVTTDFLAPTSGYGPSVGASHSGDALTYTCTSGTPVIGAENGCASAQTATTTASGTNVVSFTSGTSSHTTGDSSSITWTLPNDPGYAAGSYTATVTYTISVT